MPAENPPTRPKLFSIRSNSSRRSYQGSDHLTTPLPATQTDPPQFIDSPPYRPPLNDHVSLSQVVNHEQHGIRKRDSSARFDSRSDPFSSPEPRLSKHYTVTPEDSKHFNTPQNGFDTTSLTDWQAGGSSIHRTSTALAPAKSRSVQPLFQYPESSHAVFNAIAPHHSAGKLPDIQAINISPPPTQAKFEHFAGAGHPYQPILPTSFDLPLEIRLRRASSLAAQRSRQESLLSSFLVSSFGDAVGSCTYRGPLPKQTDSNQETSCKSTIADAVTTHTDIHKFLPEIAPHPTDMRTGSKERQNTRSTTLQVVRSRVSVYEVIWEDDHIQVDNLDNISPLSTAANSSTMLTMDFTNTKLSAWSWDGEPGSAYSNPSRDEVTVVPPNTIESSKRASARGSGEFQEDETADSCVANFDGDDDLLDDTVVKCRRHSESSPASLVPTFQQRRNLLGNRKFSNIPLEEDHFQRHRDSLVLAHKRIFHENTEQPHGGGGHPRMELKRVMKTRGRDGEANMSAIEDQSSLWAPITLVVPSAASPGGIMASSSSSVHRLELVGNITPERLFQVQTDVFVVDRYERSSDSSSDGGVKLLK